MASNFPAECCATGYKHEGNPVGEIKNINGINTYVVYPQGSKSPEKAVIVLSDIIGIYNNSQLLADHFATSGYLTVVPDLFKGDAVKLNEYESGKSNLSAWIKNHLPEHVDPIVQSTINYLRRELNVKRVGAAGYCFGGKYVCRFLKDDQIDVGYCAHPSFVTREELGAIAGPLSIAAAELDMVFPSNLRHESEEILIQTEQPWQINLFSGVVHGFAVRCNLDEKHQRFSKEQALYQANTWFKSYL